jgi:hypothetical protein
MLRRRICWRRLVCLADESAYLTTEPRRNNNNNAAAQQPHHAADEDDVPAMLVRRLLTPLSPVVVSDGEYALDKDASKPLPSTRTRGAFPDANPALHHCKPS